jgi:phosphopantothenate synthetase
MDNIVRAIPAISESAAELKKEGKEKALELLQGYDKRKAFADALNFISERLKKLAGEGI